MMASKTETFAQQSPTAEDAHSHIVGRDSDVEPVLSVVMPTLNEEEGISVCIEKVRTAVDELAVPTEIVVSDSSTDRTPEIAREMGAIVVEPDRAGYGYAYRYAFERTRGNYVVMGDADTTYDFEQIPRLLDHLEATCADIVMGSRLDGEIRDGAMPPLHRYIGNPVLTRFLNTFYDAGVSDAHSGFRIFTADALDTLELETTGMEFASEMIMEAGAKDLLIEEVPIVYHEREGEENLESIPDGWRHVRFMLVNAPSYLFLLPGALLLLVGTLTLGSGALGLSVGGTGLGTTTTIVGALALIAGFHVSSLGVFATAAADPIKRPSDPVTNWVIERSSTEQFLAIGAAIVTVAAGSLFLVTGPGVGAEAVSLTVGSIVVLTAFVIGVQSIFSAFFLRAVSK